MSVPLGLLQFTDGVDGQTLVESALRLERLGYDILWIPEVFGREPASTCGFLLGKTERLRLGTGIFNIYARDPHAAAQTAQTLQEFTGGRFVLGLGVSHPVLVEPRGHAWEKPATRMKRYLLALRAAKVDGAKPVTPAPVIIAAHGPKLLELAAEYTDGVLMYLQPPEQIAQARRVLGPDKEIHAVVRTVLCDDGPEARDAARKALGFYIQLPAYHRAWKSAGFSTADYANGGSDRLVDVIAPWGNAKRLKAVLAAYADAGASHVSLYPIHPQDDYAPDRAGGLRWDWDTLEALAPHS